MLSFLSVIADGVTIKIGDNIWSFGLNTIIYVIIAIVVGLIAEAIVGSRLPFGIVGAFIAAFIGIWLMTQVIQINGLPDLIVYNVPLIRALIGAIVLVAIWHLLTFGLGRRRRTATPVS